VKRLVCEDCGTVYYSAAAKTLVEQGATCAKCGGRLLLEDECARPPAATRPPAGNGE
jgi:DNA-directed RNA polymerase subunit RPC12/RpoP